MARVLVIEDNPANMTLAVFLLESARHTVFKAANAEVGVGLARSCDPQLILMDIQLPGMDGLAATALLKSDVATREIPVVALTALAMMGDEQRILAAGCDGYVVRVPAHRAGLRRPARAVSGPRPIVSRDRSRHPSRVVSRARARGRAAPPRAPSRASSPLPHTILRPRSRLPSTHSVG